MHFLIDLRICIRMYLTPENMCDQLPEPLEKMSLGLQV